MFGCPNVPNDGSVGCCVAAGAPNEGPPNENPPPAGAGAEVVVPAGLKPPKEDVPPKLGAALFVPKENEEPAVGATEAVAGAAPKDRDGAGAAALQGNRIVYKFTTTK